MNQLRNLVKNRIYITSQFKTLCMNNDPITHEVFKMCIFQPYVVLRLGLPFFLVTRNNVDLSNDFFLLNENHSLTINKGFSDDNLNYLETVFASGEYLKWKLTCVFSLKPYHLKKKNTAHLETSEVIRVWDKEKRSMQYSNNTDDSKIWALERFLESAKKCKHVIPRS